MSDRPYVVDRALLESLRSTAAAVDAIAEWPEAQWKQLAESGALRWNLPRAFGGEELPALEMTVAYEQLAAACLTTTFILTQRNAACQRIVDSENTPLKAKLLPGLATGELFATVGISHLTTSRQHLSRPAVQIKTDGDLLRLNGTVPWVTGAAAADFIVTGGACDDGRQMLIALPRDLQGLSITSPTRLLALNASLTSSIVLDNATAPRDPVLAGPVAGVIGRAPSGGTGSVTTSALAIGLASRALGELEAEAQQRVELDEVVAPLRGELNELRRDMYAAVSATPDTAVPAAMLRQRANSLVLRVTQANLAASKGAGYVAGHPAERAVREALFFLVWSCPQPVVAAALREFACLTE